MRPGDDLPIGRPAGRFPELEQAPAEPVTGATVVLTVIPGPRDDWFTDPDALVDTCWSASDLCDRVGVRLTGPPLRIRWPDRQLPSEGATRGAIQVPPSGQPVIPRAGPSGDRRLPRDRGRCRRRHRQARPGAARTAGAPEVEPAPYGRASAAGLVELEG